jgi:hypothetical protein
MTLTTWLSWRAGGSADRRDVYRITAAIREALGEAAFAAEFHIGRQLVPEQAASLLQVRARERFLTRMVPVVHRRSMTSGGPERLTTKTEI